MGEKQNVSLKDAIERGAAEQPVDFISMLKQAMEAGGGVLTLGYKNDLYLIAVSRFPIVSPPVTDEAPVKIETPKNAEGVL